MEGLGSQRMGRGGGEGVGDSETDRTKFTKRTSNTRTLHTDRSRTCNSNKSGTSETYGTRTFNTDRTRTSKSKRTRTFDTYGTRSSKRNRSTNMMSSKVVSSCMMVRSGMVVRSDMMILMSVFVSVSVAHVEKGRFVVMVGWFVVVKVWMMCWLMMVGRMVGVMMRRLVIRFRMVGIMMIRNVMRFWKMMGYRKMMRFWKMMRSYWMSSTRSEAMEVGTMCFPKKS